jgi:signal transduction histidine kinase
MTAIRPLRGSRVWSSRIWASRVWGIRLFGLGLPLVLAGAMLGFAMLALTTVMVLQGRATALTTSRERLQTLSLALAEQAGRTLDSVMLLQEGLIERALSQGLRTPDDFRAVMSGFAVHEEMRQRALDLPVLDAITAIDAEGRLINFSRYWPIPPVNVADRDYFQALRQAGSPPQFISAPVRNRGTGSWTIYLARRVSTTEGGFAGLVLAAIEMGYFESLYGSLTRPGEGLSLFRDDGVLLARHPRVEAFIGERFPNVTRFLAAEGRGARSAATQVTGHIGGGQLLLGISRLTVFPLLVSATMSVDLALATWRAQAGYLIGVAVIIQLAILLVGVLLRRQFHEQALHAAAEAAAAKAQAEAARLAHLGDVTTGMAHELNQPLASISMAAENAKRALSREPLPAARVAEKLEVIIAMAHRAAGIIDSMRVFGRIGRQRMQPVPLGEVFAELHLLELPRLIATGTFLMIEEPADLPPVLSMREPLIQALRKLVENACDAYASGAGDEERRLTLRATRQGPLIEIEMQDHAGGIPDDALARIFAPFYTVRNDGEGIGLGLSICFGIITELGGTITAGNHAGGTRFLILLPCAASAEVPVSALESP